MGQMKWGSLCQLNSWDPDQASLIWVHVAFCEGYQQKTLAGQKLTPPPPPTLSVTALQRSR